MEDLKLIDILFSDIESIDDNIRYKAFKELLDLTEKQVSWVYDKWYILIDKLSSANSYQRSIGIMLLANLSKSDLENKFSSILDKYLGFFEDEKFITSRQCIQNVWKIAIVYESNKKRIILALENFYSENCNLSKHPNLLKQDIITSLYQIYKHTNEESLYNNIQTLIESENDTKLIKTLRKIVNK
jgi:hypothetical protein